MIECPVDLENPSQFMVLPHMHPGDDSFEQMIENILDSTYHAPKLNFFSTG